jgi:hypothetical protein
LSLPSLCGVVPRVPIIVSEDGMEVFKVLGQPVQGVQHKNVVGDVNAEVGEGVGEAFIFR